MKPLQIYTVYLIRNNVNGKIYIGQTRSSLQKRLTGHYSIGKLGTSPISRAMREIGREHFSIEPLCSCDSRGSAYYAERILIAQWDSFSNGYNASRGGAGNPGLILSPETREMLRLANIGKKLTEVTKIKIAKTQMGKKKSPETIAKLKAALTGLKRSEESRRRISEAAKGNQSWLGRKHSEESKQKISRGNVGKPRPKSAETKRKMSAAAKLREQRYRDAKSQNKPGNDVGE